MEGGDCSWMSKASKTTTHLWVDLLPCGGGGERVYLICGVLRMCS